MWPPGLVASRARPRWKQECVRSANSSLKARVRASAQYGFMWSISRKGPTVRLYVFQTPRPKRCRGAHNPTQTPRTESKYIRRRGPRQSSSFRCVLQAERNERCVTRCGKKGKSVLLLGRVQFEETRKVMRNYRYKAKAKNDVLKVVSSPRWRLSLGRPFHPQP